MLGAMLVYWEQCSHAGSDVGVLGAMQVRWGGVVC